MMQITWPFGLVWQQVMVPLKKLSPSLFKIRNSNMTMTIYNDHKIYGICLCNDALVEEYTRLGHGPLKAKLYAYSQCSRKKSLPK